MLLGFHQAPATENMNTEARNSTDFLHDSSSFRLWIRFFNLAKFHLAKCRRWLNFPNIPKHIFCDVCP